MDESKLQPMKRRRALGPLARWVLPAALIALAALPVLALAHGGAAAIAERPAFEEASLTLIGDGSYTTERRHQAVRVMVCLRKRYRDRFVKIRCARDSDDDRSVSARVSVPGCVRGAWRTTAVGQALGRGGRWTHGATDRSPVKRCP
jgi:hypothetical protein